MLAFILMYLHIHRYFCRSDVQHELSKRLCAEQPWRKRLTRERAGKRHFPNTWPLRATPEAPSRPPAPPREAGGARGALCSSATKGGKDRSDCGATHISSQGDNGKDEY